MKKLLSILFFACCTLTGCMGHYWYKAMNLEEGGYKEYLLNVNTSVIVYEGTPTTSLSRIEKYLLYRAAEVTMAHNYDYFVVVSASPNPFLMPKLNPDYHKYISAPALIYPLQYTPNQYVAFKHSFPQRDFPRFTCFKNKAVIVIQMFDGEVPATQPYGFSASDVIAATNKAILY